jgi:hypothetical protein
MSLEQKLLKDSVLDIAKLHRQHDSVWTNEKDLLGFGNVP